MNLVQAIKNADRYLRAEPGADSVVMEYVVQSTGLTKFVRVYRDGSTQLMELPDLEELGLEVAA